MGIDPWGDFEKISGGIDNSLGRDPAYVDLNDVDVYSLSDAGLIMPLALESSGELGAVTLRLYGFNIDARDGDGDSFSLYLRDNSNSSVVSRSPVYNSPSSIDITRSGGNAVDASNENFASRYQWYLGRPPVISNQPQVSVTTTSLSNFNGSVGLSFPSMVNEAGVKSFQFQDLAFYVTPGVLYFPDWGSNSSNSLGTTGRTYGSPSFAGAELYVNGASVGRLLTSSSVWFNATSTRYQVFKVEIQNQSIDLPQSMVVNDFEIRLNYSYVGKSGLNLSSNGGFQAIVSWASDSIYSKNAVIYSDVDTSSENTGLLRGIIEFLQKIVNGISSIASAIAALPGQIANLIVEGIKSLFVPSESDFLDIQEKYKTLLSERLGFVWQIGEWVVNFGESILQSIQGGSEYVFQFPGITVNLPDGEFVFIAPQSVDLNNAAMNVVRPVAGTIISLVCVLAFMGTGKDMLIAIVSGATYFEWLKGGKGDDN